MSRQQLISEVCHKLEPAERVRTHTSWHTHLLGVDKLVAYLSVYICQQPATAWLWLEMLSAAQAACTCSARFASTGYRLLEPVQKIFNSLLVQVPPGTVDRARLCSYPAPPD
jgi:hypothetical protein